MEEKFFFRKGNITLDSYVLGCIIGHNQMSNLYKIVFEDNFEYDNKRLRFLWYFILLYHSVSLIFFGILMAILKNERFGLEKQASK